MRPLLVGDQNPYSDDQRLALFTKPAGASGDRLRRLLGMTEHDYLRTFDRMNLRDPGMPWGHDIVRARVQAILHRVSVKILLGRDVQVACGFKNHPVIDRIGTYVLAPHPSGRCHHWNDPSNMLQFRKIVNELIGRQVCES